MKRIYNYLSIFFVLGCGILLSPNILAVEVSDLDEVTMQILDSNIVNESDIQNIVQIPFPVLMEQQNQDETFSHSMQARSLQPVENPPLDASIEPIPTDTVPEIEASVPVNADATAADAVR